MIIKFGNQDAKVLATEIVRKEDVELIKADAWEACNLLNRIEVKVGILDGYAEREDPSERPCNHYAGMEFKNIDTWEERISNITINGKRKYEIRRISI